MKSESVNKVLSEFSDSGQLDDDQDKLILLDYLIIDHVRFNKKMSSNNFKSAISSYDLLSNKEFQS